MTEERLKQLQEYMELVGRVMDGELNRLQGTCKNADDVIARWKDADELSSAKAFALFAMKSMISWNPPSISSSVTIAKEGGVDECTMERF